MEINSSDRSTFEDFCLTGTIFIQDILSRVECVGSTQSKSVRAPGQEVNGEALKPPEAESILAFIPGGPIKMGQLCIFPNI